MTDAIIDWMDNTGWVDGHSIAPRSSQPAGATSWAKTPRAILKTVSAIGLKGTVVHSGQREGAAAQANLGSRRRR